MKKIALLFLCLLLILSLPLFTACGENTTTTGTGYVDRLSPLLDNPEQYVSLPALADIKIANADVEKEVDEYLAQLLDQQTDEYFTRYDGVAELGDSVNIYYTGRAKDESVTLSESTLAGMTNVGAANGADLVLGSGSFIPGFEDQLVGAKAGDHVAVELAFPDGYSAELSNLPVIFEVDVISVSRVYVTQDATVNLSYTYRLPEGEEETEEMTAFLEPQTQAYVLADTALPFDDYWTVDDIAGALMDAHKYEGVSVDLALSAEDAAELGYDHALTLTALITVEAIYTTPTEYTDELVNSLSNGAYTTVQAFRDYVTGGYRMQAAYDALEAAAVYSPLPEAVRTALVNDYYTYYLENELGDISGMTEADIEAALSAEERAEIMSDAESSAENEYKGRMLFAYLGKLLSVTLSEEEYQEKLEETYRQTAAQNPYLAYLGIIDAKTLEDYYGRDYFFEEFLYDKIIDVAVTKVSFTD